MKASVLCRLPNQRERLKHSFVGAKPADVHTASPMSAHTKIKKIITLSGQNFAHERSVWASELTISKRWPLASEMTISKRCDVPSCFLFVVVAGHVCVCQCVCVYVLGTYLVQGAAWSRFKRDCIRNGVISIPPPHPPPPLPRFIINSEYPSWIGYPFYTFLSEKFILLVGSDWSLRPIPILISPFLMQVSFKSRPSCTLHKVSLACWWQF